MVMMMVGGGSGGGFDGGLGVEGCGPWAWGELDKNERQQARENDDDDVYGERPLPPSPSPLPPAAPAAPAAWKRI
ncbi:hypothetical protein M0804_011976 [Polistes exclamans]|nr:hypothetical protein M0804_011976 [Polistes exclamans]